MIFRWVKKLINLEIQNFDFFEIPGKDVCDITNYSQSTELSER